VRVTAAPGLCPAEPPPPDDPYPLGVSATVRGGEVAAAPAVPQPLRGGGASADATLLPAGGVPITDDLAPGEDRWWRLETRDGTEAHARVLLGGLPSTGVACHATVRSRLFASGVEPIDAASAPFDGRDPVSQRSSSSAAGPIGSSVAGPAQAAGTWYLQVSLSQDTCAEGGPIPLRRYPLRVLAENRAPVPGAAEVRTSSSPSPAAVRGGRTGAPRLVWALLGTAVGVVVLAAVIAGVLALVRRRRASRIPVVPLPWPHPESDDGLYHRPRR
jgi:hypothetical protein